MIRPIAAALLLATTLSIFAWGDDDAQVFRVETLPPSAIPVIVEFRDTPLFAGGRTRIATNAREAFAQRFATFERDLAAIGRGLVRGRVAGNAATPVITERYSGVYAGVAATVSRDAIARIRELDYVRAVHLDRTMHKLLEQSVPKIKAPEVWGSFGTRGKDVIVAVIDTGIDYTHPAFGNGFGPGHRVTGGYDFVNRDADPMDDDGHGTHVAGIVGGNGGGVTGVAPEVTFLAYKVLNENGSGRVSGILSAIERAADPNQDGNPADRAHVVNLSLGGPGGPDDPLSKAVDTASAAGTVFCIAAGNDGGFQRIGSPGAASSAITVGASDSGDKLADFSSKGPIPQNLALKPEVLAPGVEIVSAQIGGGVVAHSGTSMATPHVAGVAALLRAIHPGWSPAHIKAAIVGTATSLGNEAMAEGAGRVDALRAATADVIAAQSVLSLGAVDSAAAHWTPSAMLTLINRGTTERTLSLEAPSPRAGIGVTLDVATVTLAPGASKDVRVSFDVDNAVVPAPLEGSLSYSGAIRITGGASPLHVPWAFVKGAALTLDYDGPESYEAFLANSDNTNVVRIVSEGRRTSRVVPSGTYDVVLFPISNDKQRVLVLERQALGGSATIPFRRTDAVHEIAPQAVDEQGQPLEHGRDCDQLLAVMAPQQSRVGLGVFVVQSYDTYLVSTASERFTFLPFQRCVDSAHDRVYSGQFPALRGIASPQAPVIRADEWTRTPMRAAIPSGTIRPQAALYTGWLWHSASASAFHGVGYIKPATGPVAEGTLFLTPPRHPAMSGSGKVIVFADRFQQEPSVRMRMIDSAVVQPAEDGVAVGSAKTHTPVTYVAKPGEALHIGGGPMFLRLLLQFGTFAMIRPDFRGALDDERLHESRDSSLLVRNSAGETIVSGEAIARVMYAPPDVYELTVTKPDAELRARFDNRLADGAPPTLTALRVLDANGINTARLRVNGSGTLLLSAIDVVPAVNGTIVPGAIRTDSMRVQWRAHGTTAWTPLATTLVSTEIATTPEEYEALGHPPVGTTYRADLAPVTGAAAAIDLSIRFEDPVGNSYEWTLLRAFGVEETPRRRNVRH